MKKKSRWITTVKVETFTYPDTPEGKKKCKINFKPGARFHLFAVKRTNKE